MFKLAFKILLNEAMKEHMYPFNGEMRKQAAGGAFGNILTGSLAVCFMVRWCKIFREKVLSATRTIPGFRLYMQKIYVDDKNITCEGLSPGSRAPDWAKNRGVGKGEPGAQGCTVIRKSEVRSQSSQSLSQEVQVQAR